MKQDPHIYGLLAEYDNPDDLLAAARTVRQEGYKKIDAYTPFPIHGLSDAVGFHKTKLPFIVLCGGLTGAAVGFGMQYFTSVIDYPLNIGGRPMNSWPSFIIITFELTILFSALSAVLGMLALNGLPQPYHPLFDAPNFELGSQTHFFLCVESKDPKFNLEETRKFMESLSPKPNSVTIVPADKLARKPAAH